MKFLIAVLLFAILAVLCWPVALILLFTLPFLWLLSLPFRIGAAVLHGVLALIRATLLFPARLLR